MNFDQFGRASVIPGLQYAIEILQAQLDSLRESLNGLANPEPKKDKDGKVIKYWGVVEKPVKAKKLHPRDAKHPDHEKWLTNLRNGAKKRWDEMPVRRRKTLIKNMLAGRKSA